MSQEDKTGQKGNIERDKHHLLQTRRSSCMDFSTQYLMILGFEGCTPIYNNHATTAFSMVLTPSRLGLPITRLIFVSYAAAREEKEEKERLKSVKCSRIQLWSRPPIHPTLPHPPTIATSRVFASSTFKLKLRCHKASNPSSVQEVHLTFCQRAGHNLSTVRG